MNIHFTKMHGAGNDYIFLNCLGGGDVPTDPAGLSVALSKRHFSVGADGLVLILPSKVAHARMRMFNADGSEGAICGNALRCVCKLLYDAGEVKRSRMKIETASGIRDVFLTVADGAVRHVTADMGRGVAGELNMREARGEKYLLREVNVGNEHQVAFVSDVDAVDLDEVGASLGSWVRGGINTEICEILGRDHLKMRVYERGSGETLSCGSGACAAVVAGVLSGEVEINRAVRVSTRGGELFVLCDEQMHLYLTGTVCKTFEGVVEI